MLILSLLKELDSRCVMPKKDEPKSKSWNPMSLLKKKEEKARPQSAPPLQAVGSSIADSYFSEKYILTPLKEELDSLKKEKKVSESVYNAFVKQVRSCFSKEDVQKYIAQLRKPNAAQAVTLFLGKDHENKDETYQSVSDIFEKALAAADTKVLEKRGHDLLASPELSLFKELKKLLNEQNSENTHVKKVIKELSNCANLGQMRTKLEDKVLMYPFQDIEKPLQGNINREGLAKNQEALAPIMNLVNQYLEAAEGLVKKAGSKPGR